MAVIGDATDVERFLNAHGLESSDLGLNKLRSSLNAAAGVAQAGSEIAANSGRWVKLTKESARALEKYAPMKGSKAGVNRAVVTKNGKIKEILEFAPGSKLNNPALLSGAAGLMSQLAMQQAMKEITDYLAKIDEKLDDVLRAHENAVWADMLGVQFDIEDAMTIRAHSGGVNDITWSKVQAATSTIARTQAYALRQLDGFAEKLESKAGISDLAETSREVGAKIQGWLVVLARCFQLRDAVAVLELDRVLNAAPDDLESHRQALKVTRQRRLDTISETTARLLSRMNSAADRANTKVLFNPISSPAIVESHNRVADVVGTFHERLGIEPGGQSVESRKWGHAATEVRDKALEASAETVDLAMRLGNEGLSQAKSISGKLSGRLADRARRLRGSGDDTVSEDGPNPNRKG